MKRAKKRNKKSRKKFVSQGSKTKSVNNLSKGKWKSILLDVAFVILILITICIHIPGIKSLSGFQNLAQENEIFWALLLTIFCIFYYRSHTSKLTEIDVSTPHEQFSWQFNALILSLDRSGILSIVVLMILACFVFGYDIGYYDILPDEEFHINAATGYLYDGSFTEWNFWNDQPGTNVYDRAWPYTWLVAQVYRFTEPSVVSARMVSVVMGVLFVPIIFFTTYFFSRNKTVAFITTLACILNPYFVHYFRRIRMYSMLLPLFSILVWMIYLSLVARKELSFQPGKKFNRLKPWLSFSWWYLGVSGLLLVIAFQVQAVALVIIPGSFLFLLYQLIHKKDKKSFFLILAGLGSALLILVFTGNLGVILDKLTINEYRGYYTSSFFKLVFPMFSSILLLAVGFYIALIKKKSGRMLFVYSFVLTAFMLYAFFIDYPSHIRYVLHVIPFSLMLIIWAIIQLNDCIRTSYLKFFVPVFICVFVIARFGVSMDWNYTNYSEVQFHKTAYATMVDQLDPERQIIVSLFQKNFYLKGLGNRTNRVPITNRRKYTVDQYLLDTKNYEGAWVNWATAKNNHIRPEFKKYMTENCRKIHGSGIDNTRVEMFFCPK